MVGGSPSVRALSTSLPARPAVSKVPMITLPGVVGHPAMGGGAVTSATSTVAEVVDPTKAPLVVLVSVIVQTEVPAFDEVRLGVLVEASPGKKLTSVKLSAHPKPLT